MSLNLAFLPTALQNTIQDGILERKMMDALKPLLLWRGLCQRERHPGNIGEKVTKTRTGLITPDTEASAKRTAGSDPGSVTRSVEQFGYQVTPYGKSLDIHLPSSYVAQYSRFLDDTAALGFHAAQTVGRIARGRLIAAYGGGNTYATAAGTTSTAVAVKDSTGFATVMVNGSPVAVSVSNPLPCHLGGVAVNVVAVVDATHVTLAATATWAQYDALTADDAATVIREGGRSTDHLLVAGDTATAKTFRSAAATMRSMNVPGLDGTVNGLYGCFVDPQTETALFADAEFHDAIKAIGLEGPFASGAIGDYAGIRFIRNTETTKLTGDQATIHESLMFGSEPLIEAYIPEAAFAAEVQMGGIASANHYKMPLDPDAVMTMVVRAPQDKAGELVTASWLANLDYAVPTDSLNQAGAQRYKRCALIHTAGPA